jgi:cation diffusion facilitator CzcD-associated flavoprotein CzcO
MSGVTGKYEVVVIGSGFGGIGMGIALRKAGASDFVILEKGADLGGTWRDNLYPGCACDVPSPLYSFSFELNPSWTRLFAPQPEIWDYLRSCSAKYEIDQHIRYGVRVDAIEWDESSRLWTVRTATGDVYEARSVVSAAGALHIPKFPEIAGADSFAGPSFHSSHWDHSVDLTGQRVAVIGTGASAIQFIPRIAPAVGQLSVFQRTPPWIHPRADVAMPAGFRRMLATVPGSARGLRDLIYWMLELRALGFAVSPKLMAPLQSMARRHLSKQVADPALRAALTPEYTIGCKRILLSSDYYPALQLPQVSLVTSPVTSISPSGVLCADGSAHQADVLIYATGFRVVDSVAELNVTGRGGRKLADAWQDGVEAYRGISVDGFPNFYMLLGPNTGLGHTSVVFMIESQIRHVLGCLKLAGPGGVVEVREPAVRQYNDALQRRLRKAVWTAGGCTSWYLDDTGINRAIWPGFSFEYWARTRRAQRAAYRVSRAEANCPEHAVVVSGG